MTGGKTGSIPVAEHPCVTSGLPLGADEIAPQWVIAKW